MQSVLPSAAAFATLNHRMQVLLSDPQIEQAELSQLSRRNGDLQRENIGLAKRINEQEAKICEEAERIEAEDDANHVLQEQLKKQADAFEDALVVFDELQQAYQAIDILQAELDEQKESGSLWRSVALENSRALDEALLALSEAQSAIEVLQLNCEQRDQIQHVTNTQISQLINENTRLFAEFVFPMEMHELVPEIRAEQSVDLMTSEISRVTKALERIRLISTETHVKTVNECSAVFSESRQNISAFMCSLQTPHFDSSALEHRLRELSARIERLENAITGAVMSRENESVKTQLASTAQQQTIEELSSALEGYRELLDLNNEKMSVYMHLTSTLRSVGASSFK